MDLGAARHGGGARRGARSPPSAAWRWRSTRRTSPSSSTRDRLRLAQACGNLVANAIEHGGGAVHVRARTTAGGARVEVTDTGPGLPAPVPELVSAARGRRSRRGHGLALAAGIAERHGGRLASAPSPRGARLVLELPSATP